MMYRSAKSSGKIGGYVIGANLHDTYDLRMFVMVCHDNVGETFRMALFVGHTWENAIDRGEGNVNPLLSMAYVQFRHLFFTVPGKKTGE